MVTSEFLDNQTQAFTIHSCFFLATIDSKYGIMIFYIASMHGIDIIRADKEDQITKSCIYDN